MGDEVGLRLMNMCRESNDGGSSGGACEFEEAMVESETRVSYLRW